VKIDLNYEEINLINHFLDLASNHYIFLFNEKLLSRESYIELSNKLDFLERKLKNDQ
jgi:hypothetical protein